MILVYDHMLFSGQMGGINTASFFARSELLEFSTNLFSITAKAYRAAKQTLRHYEDKEEARGNHWQSAKNRLDAALDDGRSKNTVRKAQNYERNCREKYDDAIADRRDAEKALDNAQRRLELEEAASSRLGGDVGEMVGKYAYEYGSSRKYY